MALICRATFSGLYGQRIIPSGVLMRGKEIGVQLDRCDFMARVGIEQFFDAFSLNPKRPWRTAACQALGIPASHIAEDTLFFFFLPVPCALEAQTVINTFCFD